MHTMVKQSEWTTEVKKINFKIPFKTKMVLFMLVARLDVCVLLSFFVCNKVVMQKMGENCEYTRKKLGCCTV